MKKYILLVSMFKPCRTKINVNSAISLKKFNKEYDVSIINVCGEWDDYKENIKKFY